MNRITELQNIFDSIHNVNSSATIPADFEFPKEEHKQNAFDKYVLRWF